LATAAERNTSLFRLFGPYYGALTLAWEPLGELMRSGMKEMTDRQWEEAGHDPEIPVAVDWAMYAELERIGRFRLLAARKSGQLVGWGAYFTTPSPMFKATAQVTCDSLYIDPAHRGLAPRIIRRIEAEARALGVPVRLVYAARDERMRRLLEALGYAQLETVHRKVVTP
jgi:GNAT superfamily N-acetyltransferase